MKSRIRYGSRLVRLGTAVATIATVSGCETSPTVTGLVDLLVFVVTVGDAPDPDGYTIAIDDGEEVSLPVNGETVVPDLLLTTHSYEVGGIAANCHLTNTNSTGAFEVTRSRTAFTMVVFCLQPDPGLIAYVTGSQNIRFRTGVGGDLRELGLAGSSVSVTQDGSRIAFEFDGDIWTANIDGSETLNLTNTEVSLEGRPSWSPNGTRIVFDRRDEAGLALPDIFVVEADGSGVTNLTPDTPEWYDGEPSWSPDGGSLVFRSERTGLGGQGGHLYTIDTAGGAPVQLTDGPLDTNARWSPDGERIVFTRFLDPTEGGTDFELFVINPDASGLTQLTDNGGFRTTDADWSPDGRWIVMASQQLAASGVYDLYVMRSDGSDIVQLTFGEGAGLPRWTP